MKREAAPWIHDALDRYAYTGNTAVNSVLESQGQKCGILW